MKLRSLLPELEGATAWINSGGITREELIGKPILIHFWSISCELCKRDMPKLNELRDLYEGDWQFIAVHTPLSTEDMKKEEIRRLVEEHELFQPVAVDDEDRLSKIFRVRHVPAYYLFDTEGRLRHHQSGGGGLSLLRRRMERLGS
ncbi:TlpA disulfide reductase family protein [Virgibacillus sediminis]|uniref:TlpA disulfide reductase family protein n=1 Tax=Virgibacillus sediminis TaxID=202260 RepID=A0ABV7AB37_9BACI